MRSLKETLNAVRDIEHQIGPTSEVKRLAEAVAEALQEIDRRLESLEKATGTARR
jgi:hypothetical protein